MPNSPDSQIAFWTPPECPFAVEYLTEVLDDIRVAVVDAFFSLPRGGAEIGGILMGRAEKDRIVVAGALPLECEHAFGPSFTLSENDRRRLVDTLAAAQTDPHFRPMGWYHSHTRSEIFLSEGDIEIHQRYFPEPRQVALVLRPHTFQPARAGFFFRAADGAIRADASVLEFVLHSPPLARTPVHIAFSQRAAAPVRVAEPAPLPLPVQIPKPPLAAAAPAPELEPVAGPAPAAIAPPAFLLQQAAPSSRRWLGMVAVLAVLGAAGAEAFQMRQEWGPEVFGWFLPTSPLAPAAAGLYAAEQDGQLRIHWDGSAPDVRHCASATLLIADGAEPRNYPLDAVRLEAGSMTYTRQSERVDVTLSLIQPNGQRRLQTAVFIGKTPADGGAELRRQRDELAAENAKLKQALARQTEATHRLEKLLDGERQRLESRAQDGK